MVDQFRIHLAQANPTVGDLAGNAARARQEWQAGRAAGADLVILPELFLSGAPLGDLAADPAFLAAAATVLAELAASTADGPTLGIGLPVATDAGPVNAWALLQGGQVAAICHQHRADRALGAFGPAAISGPIPVGPVRLGVMIGADITDADVAETLAETGAELLIAPQAMAYAQGNHDIRQQVAIARVVENRLPLVWLNLVGGQDDLTFDGGSFVLNPGAELAGQLPAFVPAGQLVEFQRGVGGWQAVPGARAQLPDEWGADYHAMVLGLRDYCGKSGISRVLLGLSGGLDSALVAAIAVDALGAENVRGVMLPSEYTSAASLTDAAAVAAALGIRLDTVPINGPQAAVMAALAPLLADGAPDHTEENIQARLRGLLLMALSNKSGEMLLTTSNKSELAVGYCTIYGDMAGGYNPLKDLYKTRAFAVSRWRNRNHQPWMLGPKSTVIPEAVIAKPPNAELRPDQKDEDSLPSYPVLDAILAGLIEEGATQAALRAAGHDPATVDRIGRLLAGAEWKRRQAAPGVRLTRRPLAGAHDHRHYPIVNRWRDGG